MSGSESRVDEGVVAMFMVMIVNVLLNWIHRRVLVLNVIQRKYSTALRFIYRPLYDILYTGASNKAALLLL